MNLHRRFRFLQMLFVALTMLILDLIPAKANTGGSQTGKTNISSNGCGGGCHTQSTATSVGLTSGGNSGPFTVVPGSSTSFVFTVSHATQSSAGCNIAVKADSLGTSSNVGTLAPQTGSGLQLYGTSGELTHTQPKSFNGSGSASFQFTWTAPSTPGVYYIRAVGNAVNDNNSDAGDAWRFFIPVRITVAAPSAVVTVSSPNGAEQWCAGSSQNITWTSTNVTNVKIDLSSDGGTSYPTTLVASTPASGGSWSWAIPSSQAIGSQYKIRISDAANATIKDESNNNFNIAASTAISTHPSSVTACAGGSTAFSVTATGGGLTYQWRKNGTNISGATAASFPISLVNQASAGTYDVVVTGACGTPLTSNPATLTVQTPPSISQQPASASRCVGQSMTFSVTASGSGTLSYQWRKNGTAIPGMTASAYTISAVSVSDAGSYDVMISGDCLPTSSSPATLTVNQAAAITAHPASRSKCAGERDTLIVTATGGSLIYQWRKDGVDIPGEITSSLFIPVLNTSHSGVYTVVVSNSCGTPIASNPATLTVSARPTISAQTGNQTATSGNVVTMSVTVAGSDITYQWRKGGTALTGKTSSSLVLNNVQLSDAGNYDCLVGNLCGTTTSAVAVLTVKAAGPGPILTLSKTDIDFGTIKVGASSQANVQIQNTGTEDLTISNMTLSGSTNFSLTLALPFTLKPTESKTCSIQFLPTAEGVQNAKLNFTSNAQSNPSMSLTGNGGVAKVAFRSQLLDFGSVTVGQNKEMSLVINNTGNMPLTLRTMNVSAPFSVIGTAPKTIAIGDSLAFPVRFVPTQAGAKVGEILMTFDDISGDKIVSVAGMGVAASVAEEEAAHVALTLAPNPASDYALVSFTSPYETRYELALVDMSGKTLFMTNGTAMSGANSFALQGDYPSGVYRVVLTFGIKIYTAPFIILR